MILGIRTLTALQHVPPLFDWWLWGERAEGFYLSSLVLHLANVALLFRLCWIFGMASGPALALVLLWGLHPLGG